MADTTSPNRGLALQQTGNNPAQWGVILNGNALSIIDNNLGSSLSKSVAGNSDVNLSASEAENLAYNFTGTITGNINVIWPSGAGFYIVTNGTSGAFTLTVKPTGGTGVAIAQGLTCLVFVSSITGTAYIVGTATPSGSAGGDLTGTYPNPTIAKIQGTSVSGVTGTGNAVLSASPTLSGNVNLSSLTASELLATDGSKNIVNVTALPSGTTAPNLQFTTTTGIIGTVTNDDAALGSVGEYVSSIVSGGSPVSIPSNTVTNLTSISLTGGDWDIYSEAHGVPSVGNHINFIYSSINTNSASIATSFGYSTWSGSVFTGDGSLVISPPGAFLRLPLAVTTTIYLVIQHGAASSVGFWGGIWARRRR